MKCPKCKTVNPAGSKFCKECATPLPSSRDIPDSRTETASTPLKELTTGTTFAGRYQIIEELGHGGMGKVYRALDKKLNEEVALKLIKPEIALDKGTLERFQNELKVARKIGHRNVGRMYELMEDQGLHFITMEYVPGQDLRGLIRQSKQLTVGTAVAIAKDVCSGLAEAHRLGVVHRDLKPSNIIVDKDGNARIMDFGIARSLKAKGITGAGVMIGTPEYMSPEQVEGKEVDQRSDIYSLGVILFEMTTGHVPFEGDTPFTIGVKHKSERPRNPRELNTQLPEDLSRLILRCLEKDKAKRYQTAEELIADLSAVEKALPVTDRALPVRKPLTSRELTVKLSLKRVLIPGLAVVAVIMVALALRLLLPRHSQPLSIGAVDSIAVLPFENLSRDSSQDYFSDGMADELISKLYVVSSLRVPSFRSIKNYRATKKTYREIADELKVKAILDASVLRVGDRVRVTAKLIDPATERPLWTGNYEEEMKDVLSLQSEISQAIVREVRLRVTPQEQSRLASGQQVDPTAFECYLKARQIRTSLSIDPSPERWQTGLDYLEKAAKLAPRFGPIYSEIVTLCYWSVFVGKPYNEVIGKADAAAEKARSLDPDSPEAHLAFGTLDFLKWDWKNAVKELASAVELAPGNPDAHLSYGALLVHLAHFDEGLAQMKQAIQIDPDIDADGMSLGGESTNAKRYVEAIATLREGLRRNPISATSHNYLALAYSNNGQHSEAVAEAEKSLSLLPSAQMTYLHLNVAWVYANAGRKDDARRILNKYLVSRKGKSVDGYSLAEVCAILGEKDEAFSYLERGYQEHDNWMVILKVDPALDPLHSDQRFKELLKKVGFE
jgi:serine/threonine protein kinase/Tfp pilus assembly protein PilF